MIASALLGNAAQVSGQENPPVSPKTGSIAGAAIDEKSGEGIAKALIILRRDHEGGLGEIADAKGKFTLHGVDPGMYTLTVERDGYVTRGQSQTISVQAGHIGCEVEVAADWRGVRKDSGCRRRPDFRGERSCFTRSRDQRTLAQ